MNKNEVLKTVVIVQAVCMIVLAGLVIVKVWPLDKEGSLQQPPAAGGGGGVPPPDVVPIPGNADDIIASVGGQLIMRSELTGELYRQYGDALLREMMLHLAADLEATELGVSASESELADELAIAAAGYDSEDHYLDVMRQQLGMSRARVLEDIRYRLLLEKIMTQGITVTDKEVQAYIDEHPDKFAPSQQMHLQWIMTATEAQADDIMTKLHYGEDFGSLARQYSIDEFTAEIGGDLGMVDADDPFYDKAVLAWARTMNIAEIAGPFLIDEGYVIIQLLERHTESGPTGSKLTEAVRKQLALRQAGSMADMEDELLNRHGAVIMK